MWKRYKIICPFNTVIKIHSLRASPVNAIQMNSAKISSVLRVEYFMSLVALLSEYIITYTAFHKPTLKLYQIKVKHLLYLLVSAFKYLINFIFRSKRWNYLKQVFRFKVWIGLNHFNCNENTFDLVDLTTSNILGVFSDT